jgi:hypothetical protein
MTNSDKAIVAFVKANTKGVITAAIAVTLVAFVGARYHSYGYYVHYDGTWGYYQNCDTLPTIMGVFSCHMQ